MSKATGRVVVVAGLTAIVPTTLAVAGAAAFTEALCGDSTSADCTWGLESLGAAVFGSLAFMVACPMAVWYGMSKVNQQSARRVGLLTAGLMPLGLVAIAELADSLPRLAFTSVVVAFGVPAFAVFVGWKDSGAVS